MVWNSAKSGCVLRAVPLRGDGRLSIAQWNCASVHCWRLEEPLADIQLGGDRWVFALDTFARSDFKHMPALSNTFLPIKMHGIEYHGGVFRLTKS